MFSVEFINHELCSCTWRKHAREGSHVIAVFERYLLVAMWKNNLEIPGDRFRHRLSGIGDKCSQLDFHPRLNLTLVRPYVSDVDPCPLIDSKVGSEQESVARPA